MGVPIDPDRYTHARTRARAPCTLDARAGYTGTGSLRACMWRGRPQHLLAPRLCVRYRTGSGATLSHARRIQPSSTRQAAHIPQRAAARHDTLQDGMPLLR